MFSELVCLQALVDDLKGHLPQSQSSQSFLKANNVGASPSRRATNVDANPSRDANPNHDASRHASRMLVLVEFQL